jgi:hypothetical protein
VLKVSVNCWRLKESACAEDWRDGLETYLQSVNKRKTSGESYHVGSGSSRSRLARREDIDAERRDSRWRNWSRPLP